MCDFLYVLYADPSSPTAPARLRDDMALLRSWLWEQTAYVRWRSAGYDDLPDALKTPPHIVLLDWPESPLDAPKARNCIRLIREVCPKVPIFVTPRNTILSPVPKDLGANIVELEQECFSSRSAASATWRNQVKLPLQPVKVELSRSPDLAVNLFRGAVGEKPLRLVIQKFFPDASEAQIYSVGGGWSGTKICRIFVDKQEELFYVKLFDDPEKYQTELRAHFGAQERLSDEVVRLERVRELEGVIENQFEAFPNRPFAICYRSASTKDCQRHTLEEMYRREGGPELVLRSLGRLLDALAKQAKVAEASEMPWVFSGTTGVLFDDKFKSKLLAVLERLKFYGGALLGPWKSVHDNVGKLVYGPFPEWLNGTPCAFKVGCVHGDPNCRNCLVASNNPTDLRLIDCGGFRPSGRLVTDLAIIERDGKLLLMGTEPESAPHFDLDIRQLPEWCSAESQSIKDGLEYKATGTPDSSVTRAYRLVELVRHRAKELRASDYPDDRQYFSMLLYWTLEAVLYEAVRPTKKLLALFSASQII